MAVRKIGVNSRSITGRQGFSGQQYESALERDLLDILAFDLNVEGYEVQPLRLYYQGTDGEIHPYTPDVLIRYRRDILPARDMPHLLVEVKYREEYCDRFRELRERFRAARRYARERGWQFRVMTEREIRTPYLGNARFLRPYRDLPDDPEREALILERARVLGETSPATLTESLTDDRFEQAQLLSVIWKLLADFHIGADLMQSLGMRSRIWCVEHR